jgi:hypothetical protein
VGLIIVSPMKRTIETALLAFGELVERGVPIVAHAGWQGTSGLYPVFFLLLSSFFVFFFPFLSFSSFAINPLHTQAPISLSTYR